MKNGRAANRWNWQIGRKECLFWWWAMRGTPYRKNFIFYTYNNSKTF